MTNIGMQPASGVRTLAVLKGSKQKELGINYKGAESQRLDPSFV